MRKTLAALLLAGGMSWGAQVSIGITIGPPPPPRVLRYRPAPPGLEYAWMEGYWYPVGHRYKWRQGYWAMPPYPGAVWMAPHYDGRRFFDGHWDGPRGRMERSEHDRGRGRGRGRGHDRD